MTEAERSLPVDQKLTLAELEAHSPGITSGSGDWRKAALWRWVDAISWIAARNSDLMSVLRGYRRFYSESSFELDLVEGAARTVAVGHVGRAAWDAAERELWRALEDGRLVAEAHGRGIVACSAWISKTIARDSAGIVDVVMPAVKIRHLWGTATKRPGGRQRLYDWAAFQEEAMSQLDEEGDYTNGPGWRPADLERRMTAWCDANWEKTPSESTLRVNLTKAHEKFVERRKAGN